LSRLQDIDGVELTFIACLPGPLAATGRETDHLATVVIRVFNDEGQVRPFSDEAPPSIRVSGLGQRFQEIGGQEVPVRRPPAGDVNTCDGGGVFDVSGPDHLSSNNLSPSVP
jgi:hypothetical protein